MKQFYRGLIALCLCLPALAGMSQDIHLSQFHQAPLYRNPALAGIMNGDIRVQTTFRSQWNSIANAYKTGALSFEYKTKAGQGDDYLTLGLQTYFDKSGTTDLSTTIVMPAVNFHKSVSEQRNAYLSAAFMGGIVQKRFDRSKMTTNNSFENGVDGEEFAASQYAYLDGSFGLSYNTELGQNEADNLVIGVAYHHLNKPRNSFFTASAMPLDPKMVISADLRMDVGESSTVTVYSDVVKQGSYTEVMGGLLYGMKMGELTDNPDYILSGGLFLRWNDALIPTIKLDYRPFDVALSYDVNFSKLSAASIGRGGFELSVSYVGFLNKFNSTLESLKCPRF